jgi:hypothetical protein
MVTARAKAKEPMAPIKPQSRAQLGKSLVALGNLASPQKHKPKAKGSK